MFSILSLLGLSVTEGLGPDLISRYTAGLFVSPESPASRSAANKGRDCSKKRCTSIIGAEPAVCC